MGYDTQWARFSASNFGAPHQRDRLWLVGNSRCERLEGRWNDYTQYDGDFTDSTSKHTSSMAYTKGIGLEQTGKCKCSPTQRIAGCSIEFSNANSFRCEQMEQSVSCRTTSQGTTSSAEHSSFTSGREWWAVEPRLGRVADGVANRVDRLKAIGNGQVSIVAVNAYQALGANL